jgi:hypothetical protein
MVGIHGGHCYRLWADSAAQHRRGAGAAAANRLLSSELAIGQASNSKLARALPACLPARLRAVLTSSGNVQKRRSRAEDETANFCAT